MCRSICYGCPAKLATSRDTEPISATATDRRVAWPPRSARWTRATATATLSAGVFTFRIEVAMCLGVRLLA